MGFGGGGETAVLQPIGRGRANHLAGSGRGDEGNGRWAGGLGSGRRGDDFSCHVLIPFLPEMNVDKQRCFEKTIFLFTYYLLLFT